MPQMLKFAGADPGLFLGGGALVSCSTSTPINHPLHPPPRSAPGDSTLEIGAAQLPSVTEIAPLQRFLCVNRCPIQYYFRGGAKGIRSSVTLHPPPRSAPGDLEIGAAQLRSVTEIAPRQPFLCEQKPYPV